MTTISDEIQQLQLRISQLETQQKEMNENNKTISIEHNFDFINNLLSEKKTKIINYNKRFVKNISLSHQYHDQELVTYLEAIYNILKIIDKRLQKLEQTEEDNDIQLLV